MSAPFSRLMPYLLTVLAIMMVPVILAACGGEATEIERGRESTERPPATKAAGLTPEPEPTTVPEREPTAEATLIRQPAPTVAPTPAPMLASTTTPEPAPTAEPAPTVAPTPAPMLTDREILELFYHATDGPNWTNNENWLSNKPLGEWYGVTTDAQGHVIELDFFDWATNSGNGLAGELPPELGNLSKLRELNLALNELWGDIPPELGNLTAMTELDLYANQLSGEIPPELGKLSLLKKLTLGFNQLSGNIPPELGDISSLEFLWINDNQLSGSIPEELERLSNLKELEVSSNQLSGDIPDGLANLVHLTRFSISRNQLSGNVPPWLGYLYKLEYLGLRNNQLKGGLPGELGNLGDLEILYLDGNRLSGKIPQEWGNMSSLRAFKINDTSIAGCLPAKWVGQVDPDYSSTDVAGLPFCEAAADSTPATTPSITATPTPSVSPESAAGETTAFTVDTTTLAGPASLPQLGDENGDVPLDALERHRWIYESGYYQSLLEKANFDSPTPLTSRGHRIVIEHVCGHGDISPCVLLRDFFAPNLLERTEGQVNFQVVTYREARANASRILAALLDGGVDSATIYSWVLPEGRIQFLLGLYQSSELEFQATQAIMPDLEQAHVTASGGMTFSRGWSPGGDYYLFCGDRIESPEDLKGKLIHGPADWVEGMGATHQQLVSGTGEMFAALNEGNVDCVATTAGTGHDNHFWAAARYMGGPLVSFNFLHNVVSGQKWNSIPSDLQQIFLEEAARSELEELRLASVLDERGLNALRGRNLEPVPLSPSLLDHSFNIAAKDYVIPAWVELVGDPNDPIITDTFNNKIGPIVGLLINPDGTVSSR